MLKLLILLQIILRVLNIKFTLNILLNSGAKSSSNYNGNNSFLQEFAIMSDNNLLVSIGSSILSGNFYLNATPEVGVSGIMTCRLLKTNIT